MKVSIEVTGDHLLAQKDNITEILGRTDNINFETVNKLTINYKIDLPVNKDMLKRLRALVELAEESSSLDLESEEGLLLDYSECMRLMQDLVSISEKKRIANWD